MSTGTGKTVTIGSMAVQARKPVLWLAHRYELLTQARDHLAEATGAYIGLEQAGSSSDGEHIVVASVQTMCRDNRLSKFARDHFGLIVVDEAHHIPGKSYGKVLDHFAEAKVVGCTATPDRLDKVGLHVRFDSVAYVYDMVEAIRDGYLCRILAKHVDITAIDLRPVGTLAGDLNQVDLDAVMRSREAIHGIVVSCLKECGDRPTFVFTTSVANANAMTEVFNAYRPGCAETANGTTDFAHRASLLELQRGRRFQFFVSVGIHTEGVDAPWVSCVALGRPTKSRALLAQMVGRGTRPGKPDLLVLDFVGNTGRHKLVTVADILGGKFPNETIAKVAKQADGQDVLELIDNEERARIEEAKQEAKRQEEREKERTKLFRANVTYKCVAADLFGHYRLDSSDYLGRLSDRPDVAQVARLTKYGIPIPPDLTRQGASAILKKEGQRRHFGWAPYKMVALLGRYGIDGHSLRFGQAKARIDQLAKNGWVA